MKKILACCLILFLFACDKKEKEVVIPATVLSKEKMADIIMQISLEEARINLSSEPGIRAKADVQELVKKNNLNPAQYDSSLVFYLNHPELLKEVYEITLADLTKKQSEAARNKN